MGEAKRRRKLDPLYGKETWIDYPPLLDKPCDSVIRTAVRLMDCSLAVRLFIDFDSEQVVALPKEESRLPDKWPYHMRQLEAHPLFNDWMWSKHDSFCSKHPDIDKRIVHLRLHQWGAFVVDLAGYQIDLSSAPFIESIKWDVDALIQELSPREISTAS